MSHLNSHSRDAVLAGALVLALALAPAALAAAPKPGAPASKPAAGTTALMVTPAGTSVSFLLHHAYQEAMHGQSSLALHMPDMARNHFANVDILLGAIDPTRDVTEPKLRTQIQALQNASRNVGSSGATPEASAKLVGLFVELFDLVPEMHAMAGGGGGGMTPMLPMMHTPAELVAMAGDSAVNAQTDIAMQDYAGATLHIRHTVAVLGDAMKSAQLHHLGAGPMRNLQALQAKAQRVATLVASKTPTANTACGQLVTAVGGFLPSFVATTGNTAAPAPGK